MNSKDRTDGVCMSPLTAARLTAEDYVHEGIHGMALALGKNYETFRKELAGAQGYKLSLLDAVRMMTRSGDHRIADAIEAELGRYAMPVPATGITRDRRELSDHIVRITKEFGDVLQETTTRAADGDISDNDVREIAEQWGQLVAEGSALMRFIVSRNLERKPGGGVL